MSAETQGFLEDIRGYVKDDKPGNATGTVDAGYVSGRPRVLFDGETVLGAKAYPYLASYVPRALERVVLAPVGKGFVILGAIAGTTGSTPKGFRATGGNATLVAGGAVAIPLTTAFNDDTSLFTLSGNSVTVASAGLYVVSWEVNFSLNSASSAAAYITNASTTLAAVSSATNGTGQELNGHIIARLTAGSVLTLYASSGVAGSASGSNNHLALVRLAP